MSVRVRFAPSPTGHLHIGGARTALYCWLFAKANSGTYVLRVEDTDVERSTREFEESQIDDLKWLGLEHDEGPDRPGDLGPYRQSERLDLYKKYAWELVEKGHAFPCFCTPEELETAKEKAMADNRPPHYDGTHRDLPLAEAKSRIDAGEEYVIRFKVPHKSFTFFDHVRKEVTFPEDMVGDFVILRSNGMPTYNFCCVVDDWQMKISHVFRAEDHLNNTVRQLMIYEALGAPVPQFAHFSLLVGHDRQKLSKRHGATSVKQYRKDGYLPQALLNYLCLLGWSHPDEQDIFLPEEIVTHFNLKRFNKSAATYDMEKLNFFNEQHLRNLNLDELLQGVSSQIPSGHDFHDQAQEWKLHFCEFFRDKIQNFHQINEKLPLIFSDHVEKDEQFNDVLSWETTPIIKSFLATQLGAITDKFIDEEILSQWMDKLKKEHKVKGKNLFMGLRICLTGHAHGPDLKTLVSLTPLDIVKNRLSALS